MHKHLGLGSLALLLAGGVLLCAADVPSAVAGTVKSVDKATKTVVVKTAAGTEETFHYVGTTVAHGAEAAAKGTATASKDAFEGVKAGEEVVVHYTVKGAQKTATEVDRVGKSGLKKADVAVTSVGQGAKTVTAKTAEGAEETYHLTDNAVKASGKGLATGGQTTVYYTEKGGKKVAHFFTGH